MIFRFTAHFLTRFSEHFRSFPLSVSIAVPRCRRTARHSSKWFKMIVFQLQTNLSSTRKRQRPRIKGGHSPLTIVSCFLKPEFIVCSPFRVRLFFDSLSLSLPHTLAGASLINLCRVLQQPGKREGSFLLVVGVTSGGALGAPDTESEFPEGETPLEIETNNRASNNCCRKNQIYSMYRANISNVNNYLRNGEKQDDIDSRLIFTVLDPSFIIYYFIFSLER